VPVSLCYSVFIHEGYTCDTAAKHFLLNAVYIIDFHCYICFHHATVDMRSFCKFVLHCVQSERCKVSVPMQERISLSTDGASEL